VEPDGMIDSLTVSENLDSSHVRQTQQNKKNNQYKYIAVYVDDLAIAMKNPKEKFTDVLENKHKFKLKGTGPIAFHLGMDFTRDNDGTLCISPTKYIEKLIKNYEKSFGIKPKQFASPLEKGDHPELDTTELCTAEQVAQYQSMIGSLQWIVTIGRFDIHTAVIHVWILYCSQNRAPRKVTT
jgi:Reverse transcriptase (RNA-dependent DNA polymerase)